MKSMSMIFVPEGTDIGVMPAYLQRIIIARLGTEFHAGAWKQIGTRAYDGKFPVYVWTDAEPDELDFLCTLMVAAGFGWEFVCGQSGDARDTGEVDAEGNPIYAPAVYRPVPASFIDWIEDEQVLDAEGNVIGTQRPTAIPMLAKTLGAEDWVIEQ